MVGLVLSTIVIIRICVTHWPTNNFTTHITIKPTKLNMFKHLLSAIHIHTHTHTEIPYGIVRYWIYIWKAHGISTYKWAKSVRIHSIFSCIFWNLIRLPENIYDDTVNRSRITYMTTKQHHQQQQYKAEKKHHRITFSMFVSESYNCCIFEIANVYIIPDNITWKFIGRNFLVFVDTMFPGSVLRALYAFWSNKSNKCFFRTVNIYKIYERSVPITTVCNVNSLFEVLSFFFLISSPSFAVWSNSSWVQQYFHYNLP